MVPDAERQFLTSAITKVEYQIDVALPQGYTTSDNKEDTRRYPVLFVLDGNAYFTLVHDTVRLLTLNGWIKPVIVVGVGYRSPTYPFWSKDYFANRTRDYTTRPARSMAAFIEGDGGGGEPGGAPDFVRFLREELIPYVDSRYRTLDGDRAVMGHSFGGLLSVYVLTHQPDTFNKYLIGSPSLWWDDQVCFRWESDYAAHHNALAAQVYLYLGGFEPDVMATPPTQLWKRLESRHYTGLQLLALMSVADETHTSVNLSATEGALKAFYDPRPKPVSLGVDVLRRYTGTWTPASGPAWKIRLVGNRLVLDEPGAATQELVARSAVRFSTRAPALGFWLSFTLDPSNHASELSLWRPPHFENGQMTEGGTLVLHRTSR